MYSHGLQRLAPLAALSWFAGTAAAQVPQCRNLSYHSNFRLNGAQQHIEQAGKSSYEPDKQQRIADALNQLQQAAQGGNGVDQTTLWYFFGQVYLLKHDLLGADSAFTKAEAKTDEECKRDILRRRRNEWVGIQNAGVEQMGAGNNDSALVLFRRANLIYRSEPFVYLNMATIFYNRAQTDTGADQRAWLDSAIVSYRAAARSTNDQRREEARVTALFNAARLLHTEAQDSNGVKAEARRRSVADTAVRRERFERALEAYREVLSIRPRDMAAQASLAGVLSALHRADEARAVYYSMLAHADNMSSFELFDAGVALFRQERYDLTARAIELGLAKNRCARDALFNLANTYLAARDSVHLLDAARRLVAIDSMNRTSLRLLAAGEQKVGDQQGTLRALVRADSLRWEIQVLRFEPGDTTASVTGVVMNLQGKALPGFRLTIQYVNGACESVTEQAVDIPDLNPAGSPGASYDFRDLRVNGKGIVAWKYKVN
jgi:tetratricopeptide (TPR) repeat protein